MCVFVHFSILGVRLCLWFASFASFRIVNKAVFPLWYFRYFERVFLECKLTGRSFQKIMTVGEKQPKFNFFNFRYIDLLSTTFCKTGNLSLTTALATCVSDFVVIQAFCVKKSKDQEETSS